MKETSNPIVREGLVMIRAKLLSELVALAQDSKQAERLLSQINAANDAIADTQSPAYSWRFCKYKSAILAIVAYLEEIDRPVSPDEIVEALVAGGFRGGDLRDVRTKVFQSINAGLTNKIKVIKDLVGLIDWPKSKFSP